MSKTIPKIGRVFNRVMQGEHFEDACRAEQIVLTLSRDECEGLAYLLYRGSGAGETLIAGPFSSQRDLLTAVAELDEEWDDLWVEEVEASDHDEVCLHLQLEDYIKIFVLNI